MTKESVVEAFKAIYKVVENNIDVCKPFSPVSSTKFILHVNNDSYILGNYERLALIKGRYLSLDCMDTIVEYNKYSNNIPLLFMYICNDDKYVNIKYVFKIKYISKIKCIDNSVHIYTNNLKEVLP